MRRPVTTVTLRSAVLRALLACLAFASFAVWSTYPLILDLGGAVPGADAGDNMASLWNTWWFTYALAHDQPLYWTDRLFAPFGTQLSLHTHATTHSAIAWPFTRVTSIVAAHNIAMLVGLALNGFCAYVLASRITGRFYPAMAAGIVVASSAFVQLHLLGHANLVHVWVVLLFALALISAGSAPAWRAAILLGLSAAIVVYTDYYFAVFCFVFALCWTAAATTMIQVERRDRPARRLIRLVSVLTVLALGLVITIALTGGTTTQVFGRDVSVRGVRNPLTAFWVLAATSLLLRFRVAVRRTAPAALPLLNARLLAIAAAVALAGTTPLWRSLLEVVRSGQYVSQRVLWRSSPPGADALTVALGNPRHAITGPGTTAAYDFLGIDVIEQTLWLGLVSVVALLAWRAWRNDPLARPWVVTAFVFGVWSLGPFLRVAGFDTALPLPGALTRYLPVLSNARIPGRAVIMAQIAVAMLLALALKHRNPRGILAATLSGILLFEAAVAPVPLTAVPPADSIDHLIAAWPVPGSVVELPLGIRDGFGQHGDFDHRALVRQIWHERPLVGGFVARLAPATRQQFLDAPLLRMFAGLTTDGADARLPVDTLTELRRMGVLFLVVNRDRTTDPRLLRPELERLGLEFLHAEGPRELYRAGAR